MEDKAFFDSTKVSNLKQHSQDLLSKAKRII